MSDTPEIQPALSAEEWAEFLDPANAGWAPHVYANKNDHAAAAVGLYGQPFGFTHKDVARLRDRPELYGGLQGTTLEREWHAFLDSIADRIAALLPPAHLPEEDHLKRPFRRSGERAETQAEVIERHVRPLLRRIAELEAEGEFDRLRLYGKNWRERFR